CATLEKAQIRELNSMVKSEEMKLLADEFTATLEPNTSLSGKVICADTGAPMPGATVSLGVFSTLTDDQGRYSFDGFGPGRKSWLVRPAVGADYLGQWVEEESPKAIGSWRRDFALQPGCVVTGRIREKETGQPIRIPHVGIGYVGEKPTD